MSHEQITHEGLTFTLHMAQDRSFGWMCDVCGASGARGFDQEAVVEAARAHLESKHGDG